MTEIQTISGLSPAAISAMSALNSHVRSSNARFDERLKGRVYAMKKRAIDLAEMAGLAMFRPISVSVTCNTCHGDGLYQGRWKCNRCNGTGTATLYFRETRIGKTLRRLDWESGDVVWHTPTGSGSHSEFVQVSDWKPMTVGKELSIDELVSALNIAEPVFAGREHFEEMYSLSLGSDIERCAFCASKERLEGYHVPRGRLEWSASACDGCRGHFKANERRYSKSIFDCFPIPKHLFTPAIDQWIERHGGIKALMSFVWDGMPR